MKYILHYVNKMHRGGMESFIMNVYRNIDRNKFQFHFAVHSSENADFNDEIKEYGGEIIVFPKFRSNPILYKSRWNDFWKENKNKYHAFQFHTNSLANIESIKAAKRNNFNKIIIHAHSSYASKGKLQNVHDLLHKNNQKYVKNNNIHKVAVSEKASNWVFGEISDNSVNIIDNGIDYEIFSFSSYHRGLIRAELGINNDEIVIGQVGNFNPVKNHIFTIKVFKEFENIHPRTKLVLLGTGTDLEKIKELVKDYKLEEKTLFLDNVPNVFEYLNAMDVLIFPSLFEGLGLVAIEAQVNGLPVLYSDTIPESIEISDNVISYSLRKTPEQWSQKLFSLASKRGENSYLKDRFDVRYTVEKMERIYNSL